MSQFSCLDCFRKHVATAMVFEDEASIGGAYPLHKWYAIGELNAAAKEIVLDFPILATITRQHCKEYQDNDIPVPTETLLQLANEIEENENSEEIES